MERTYRDFFKGLAGLLVDEKPTYSLDNAMTENSPLLPHVRCGAGRGTGFGVVFVAGCTAALVAAWGKEKHPADPPVGRMHLACGCFRLPVISGLQLFPAIPGYFSKRRGYPQVVQLPAMSVSVLLGAT